MTVDEFERGVRAATLSSKICQIPQIRRSSASAINLRVPLVNGDFIDVFYNEVSDTTAYALIRNNQRIYGADNTGGWHYHPFDAPEEHVPLAVPLFFSKFLEAVERYVENG